MGAFHTTAKWFLILTNFIFMAVGIFLFGVGGYLDYKYESSGMNSLFPEASFVPKVVIIIGVVTALVYFIGFWGACKEKRWMLHIFGTIIGVMLIFKIGVGLFMAAETTNNQPEIHDDLLYQQEFKIHDNNDKMFVDAFQNYFQCCGYYDPSEMKYSNGTYISSCCGYNDDSVCEKPLFTEGCYYKFEALVTASRAVYYTIFTIQAMSVLAAFLFASSILRRDRGKPVYKNFA